MTWSKSSFGFCFCFFKILPNLRLHLLVTQLPVSNFNSLNETLLPKDQFWFNGLHRERGGLTNNSITLKSFNSPYAISSRRKLTILLECKLCNNIAGEQLWKPDHFQPALLQPLAHIHSLYVPSCFNLCRGKGRGEQQLPAFQWCSKSYQ